MFLEWIRYVKIDRGEWSFEGREKLPACSKSGNGTARTCQLRIAFALLPAGREETRYN